MVLGCMELKETAKRLLENYETSSPHADTLHPQYIAMSIWTAAK